MSYLTIINNFLESTRDLTGGALNALIKSLDSTAEQLENPQTAHSVLGYMKSAEIKGFVPSFTEALVRVNNLKSSQGWLYIEPTSRQRIQVEHNLALVEDNAVVKINKQEVAQQIYDQLEDKSKATVIAAFVEQLGVSTAGAQTYYYSCGGERAASPNKESKADRASAIYQSADDKSRSAIVNRFINELEMTAAGAQTYFYNCKKSST